MTRTSVSAASGGTDDKVEKRRERMVSGFEGRLEVYPVGRVESGCMWDVERCWDGRQ